VKYLETTQTLYSVSRDVNENDIYIQVDLDNEKPAVGEDVAVTVLATEPLTTLTYKVFGRRNVVVSEIVAVPNVKEYKFNIKSTPAMAPKAFLVVYFITEDGEIISDRKEIEFGEDLGNSVS